VSDESTTIREALPIEVPLERVTDPRLYRWFEVSLVLLVSFGSSILNSLYLLRNGRVTSPYLEDFRWTISILQELTALLLLAYVLSRRRMRLRDLGLRWSFGDLGTGLIVTFASYLTYAMGYSFVHSIHRAMFSSASSGLTPREIFAHPSMMAVPLFLLNPFFEELIVRAYLMTEVRDLTGSWTLSAALSIAVQFSYHLYYGWERAIAMSFPFLVFSIYYANTRKVTPIIVAHGIFDIYGLIRLW
jgi:membrane protease YdiL (CAAX protease family)